MRGARRLFLRCVASGVSTRGGRRGAIEMRVLQILSPPTVVERVYAAVDVLCGLPSGIPDDQIRGIRLILPGLRSEFHPDVGRGLGGGDGKS